MVETITLMITALLLLVCFVMLLLLLRRSTGGDGGAERTIREELRIAREESSRAARDLREEVAGSQQKTTDSLVRTLGAVSYTHLTLPTTPYV